MPYQHLMCTQSLCLLLPLAPTLAREKAMQRVSVREAREQISRLLDAVEAGEEVIILRRGKPTARLVAVSHAALLAKCTTAG